MPVLPRAAAILALLAALAASPAGAQSLEAMAGQMIMVGFAGNSASDASVKAVAKEIAAGDLGGVMFLKTNVASKKAVVAMNAMFRAANPALPPFISLDQEGGAVERLTAAVGFPEMPSAKDVAAANTPEAAKALYAAQAQAIAQWGFNLNFAPVADLSINPDNQVIAKFGRAFSADADKVAAYDAAVIDAHHAAGLLTSLKHFPGHGSSTADSHEGYVDITRSWQDAELTPYRKLIAGGYQDFVMVGHLIHKQVDPSGEPSSLSKVWIEDVLRGQLGFRGVVISDDLEMGAIRKHYSLEETVVKAVEAGMDVLLFSNTAKARASLGDEVRAIIVKHAEADPAFRARVETAYGRIVALKARIASR